MKAYTREAKFWRALALGQVDDLPEIINEKEYYMRLYALKLLGGDCIESIGVFDLNGTAVTRWVTELGQVSWPWDYDALPEVEPVGAEDRVYGIQCDSAGRAGRLVLPD